MHSPYLHLFAILALSVPALSAADAVTVDASGNIGVGVAPTANQGVFQVVQPVLAGGNPASTGSSDANQFALLGNGSLGLRLGLLSNGNVWMQPSGRNDYGTNYSLLLCPNGGNVGIGTVVPSTVLDVNGVVTASNIVISRTSTAVANEVVRGDDPRLAQGKQGWAIAEAGSGIAGVGANITSAPISTIFADSGLWATMEGAVAAAGAPYVTSPQAGRFTVGSSGAGRYRLALDGDFRRNLTTGATAYSFTVCIGIFKNGSLLKATLLSSLSTIAANNWEIPKSLVTQASLLAGDYVEAKIYVATNLDTNWSPQVRGYSFDVMRIGD